MNRIVPSKGLTPKIVAETNYIYSIPIYQRLFEWDSPRIIQLLDDLSLAYSESKSNPYYIGMLTSNDCNELIDGQQRFTVMMLLGFVFSKYFNDWERFLFVNGKPRLYFKARSNDNSYIMKKCLPSVGEYENLYMKSGIVCIKEYIKVKNWNQKDIKTFAQFIFEKMTFFISIIPKSYSPRALNKYFETMNSTGKNLENHEILKVKMLKYAKKFNKVQLSQIWNAVSDMDQKLIRRRKKEERQTDLNNRFIYSYNAVRDSNLDCLFEGKYINDLSNDNILNSAKKAIGNIEAIEDKPKQQRLSRGGGFHSIISFSEFLLQILWMTLNSKMQKDVSIESFFDVNKLQETFNSYWNIISPDTFILSMLRYRLLFDKYVINISNNDATFELEINDSQSDDYGNSYHELLLMYESMLYVNSSSKSYYLWLPSLLTYSEENEYSCKQLYTIVKKNDEEKRHPKDNISDINTLSYTEVDRYWFWKLDFEIWRRRKELFKDEEVLQVAENYSFRRARSIEHIAPQTPEQENTLKLTDEVRNSFGNLVMISSAQNSSLQNSTFEIKRAKVQSHINKELNGTIESLKMLMIYQYPHWNESVIKEHMDKCLKLLQSSFE